MRGMRIALIAIVAACLVAAAPSSAGRTAARDQQLVGTTGPGFVITLEDANGAKVTHLDPGTYTLLVHDKSDLHDFHLVGPGVNVATDVFDIGDKTFTITLTDGVYDFQCDAHPLTMKGAFAVGSATLPPPTTTTTSTTPTPPAPRPLTLSVGPGRRLTAPAKLRPGRYVVTARDSSATDDLHLKGKSVDRKTGVAFKGKVLWKVTLKAGAYRVFSDAHPTLTRTITVR
jgi:plastocyanin